MHSQSKKKITIFDLDLTLTRSNVSFAFGKELYKSGKLPMAAMFTIVAGYFSQKIRLITLKAFHELAFNVFFKNKNAEQIKKLADLFIQKQFHSLLRPSMIQEYYDRKKGSNCFIHSSTPSFLVEPIKKLLSASGYFATEYAIDESGCFSYIEKIVDGKAKADYLVDYRKNNEILEVAFYTDSIEDLALLQIVDEPIVVNPRGKLKMIASKNLWKRIYIS